MQLTFFAPESNWIAPNISSLPDWEGIDRIAIDTETKDPFLKTLGISVRRGGYIVGVSFAIEDGPSFYLPIRHEGGGNLPEQEVLKYLRDNAKRFRGILVGANLPYDLDYLFEEKIEFPNIKFFRDVQIAAPLINELYNSYSLKSIAERCGLAGKDESLLIEAAKAFNVDPKAGLYKLHAKYVGPYAEQDASSLLPILRKLEKQIDEEDLWRIYDLESRVQPVLVKMRRRGVRIDTDKLSYVEDWSLQEELEALQKVRNITGVSIAVGDIWKSERILPVLESIGVPITKTPTGKTSVKKDILDGLDHPATHALLWARKVNKLRTTFAASVREHMVNGRIHATFNQLPITKDEEEDEVKGARYGRLSCESPNLQQQPSRDEFAKLWRSIYIPEEGSLWACNDYSQQEPRMLTHFAEICKLPRAAEAAEKYRQDPLMDNHQMMAEMAGIERKPAKEIFLGKCYGMGGYKLAIKLDLPTRWAVYVRDGSYKPPRFFENGEEAKEFARKNSGQAWPVAGEKAQQIIDKFDEQLPFVKSLADLCKKRAQRNGFIQTLGGRKCHFPIDERGQYDWTQKALNRLIQGSSADQTKQALVDVDAAGHILMLQVHDELDLSVSSPKEAKEVAEIMKNCMKLNVPFKVDVEIGKSWGELDEVRD